MSDKKQTPVERKKPFSILDNGSDSDNLAIPRKGPKSISRSLPEVDPDAERRAMQALHGDTDAPVRGAASSGVRKRKLRRKATDRRDVANIYIHAPAPVIEAFNRYRDEQGFVNHWSTLEDLLIKAGVEIEDFD